MIVLLLAACGDKSIGADDTAGSADVTPPDVVLNEFLARNDAANADAAGEFDDWVELYNTGDSIVSLDGLYLTDDETIPTKFALDASAGIDAGDWAVIWCDDQEEQGADHAGFKIGGASGFLGLYLAVDGGEPVAIDTITYEAQVPDVSMARTPDGSVSWASDATPTPRASNGS